MSGTVMNDPSLRYETAQATMELRWIHRGMIRVLQQKWIITSGNLDTRVESVAHPIMAREEWRDVPGPLR